MQAETELTLEVTQDCVRRFLNGESAAMEPIYRAHYRSLFVRACAFLKGDPGAAEECVQNTFVKALKYLDSYERTKPIGHWLMRILRNVVVDYVQKRGEVDLLSENEERTLAAPPSATDAAAREALAESAQRAARIHQALATLSEEQRRHVHLFHFMNLSHAEIARVLNITEDNSRQKLKRIREKLKSVLDPGMLQGIG